MLQPTAVVVEDRLIASLVRAVLVKRGYDVMVADGGSAGSFLRRPDSYGILVTNTPGDFLEFSGHVPLVYVTSHPDPRWQAAFRKCRVIPKPFTPEDLAHAVAESVDQL